MPAGTRRRALIALLAIAALAAPAVAAATPRHPHGAAPATAATYRIVGAKLGCGRVAGRWLPASRASRRWFVTAAQRSKNFAAAARHASGRQRAHDRARSRYYAWRASAYRRACGPVRFHLAGARGLALHRAPSLHGGDLSNLDVVGRHGRLRDAVTSGGADVAQTFNAPGGKIYVLFKSPIVLDPQPASSDDTGSGCDDGSGDDSSDERQAGDSSDDGSSDDTGDDSGDVGSGDDSSDDGSCDDADVPAQATCLLAEVDPASQKPACVDSTLYDVPAPVAGANPRIQFDDKGAIYYMGAAQGGTVLRRYLDGTTTDYLSSAQVLVDDFAVLGDGDVLITGATLPTGARWVRRIGPDRVVHQVRSVSANWLRVFPDGNAYLGMWAAGNYGVRQFTAATNTLESRYWLSDTVPGQAPPDTQFNVGTVCAGADDATRQAFCDVFGSTITSMTTTAAGRVYGVAGTRTAGRLVEYYPDVVLPPTSVTEVSVTEPVGDDLALAGTDADDHPVLVLHDTKTDAETTLIGADADLEVYHLSYDAKANQLLFDGLRFADDKYVLGQVDVASGKVTIDATGTKSWSNVQAVSSR